MSNSFKFFASYLDAARQLREKERGELLFAIVSYGIDGEEIPLRKSLQPIWSVIKPTLEKSRKLQSYGEKGGRPKKPTFDKVEKPTFQVSESPLSENEKPDKDKEYGERNKDKKKPSKEKDKPVSETKRFVPPTLEESEDYFVSKGSDKGQAHEFWYFYGSKGWMVGKNKMQNWHMAASRWIASKRDEQKNQPVKRTAEEDYTDLFAEMFGGQENDNTVSGTACEVD